MIKTSPDETRNLLSLRIANEGPGIYTVTVQAVGTGSYTDGLESEASDSM